MAARATSAFNHLILILSLFLLINYNSAQRFGDRANNLHIVDSDDYRQYKRPLIIERNTDDTDDFETSFGRVRRDISANNPNITTKLNALNDSHQQLMVHWVGEGSNVIICLARDSTPLVRTPASTNPSAVYISYNYGESFENKTDKFKISDSNDPNVGYATLDKFYNHPKFNTHCVFADSSNKLIFTTWNNGKDITRENLPFHPSDISFHEDDPLTFLALDKIDPERKLWLTRDLGKTWVSIQEYVKAFFWTSTQPKALLVERHEPSGVNTVLSSTGLFQSENNFTVVIANVEDFQIRGDYMFATKKTTDNDLDLHISYKQRPFVEAQFNSERNRRDYHIADVSNNRVLVAVSHTEFLVNLYVSDMITNDRIEFTLSLEKIVTFFPNSTWKDSWLNEVSDEAFTDLYKVEGLRGIYIASQIKDNPKSPGPEHLTSLITYDHGASWSPIKAPKVDNDGFFIPCHDDPCSLHLSQKFSQLYPATRSVSIMSSKSAPGIIIATGVIGKSLKGHPGVFVSRDAGLTWKQVLKDYYFFNMGDHGGVLVAVKYFKSRGETREILYSTNEGESWHTHEFNEDMLRVYGLMTEPGENTTVFTMFGSGNGQHQWLIVKVDLRKVFERDCNEDDFKFWSPSSTDQPTMACVLGRKETYQRRAMRANCYTGIDYDRPVKLDICQCDAKDYRCDIGFYSNMDPNHCIRNKTASNGFDPYAIPETCQPGSFYFRTKGYRKIEDDECTDGLARNFEPDEIPCPMKEISEFLLVAQRDHISRIDLKEVKLEALPVHGLKNVIAIEFDLQHDCLYWADIVNDTIGRQCLKDGTSYPEILVETDLSSIEGMAFDWVSKVLYFVDGVKMRIEIIRVDVSTMGRMRRTILGPDKLKKPRGIAVHPMQGYMFWTDWAPGDGSVSRANLNGTNVKRLFGKDTVEWPNGITIDHIAERIYWVDAKLDYIGSSDLDGQRYKQILAHDDRLSHPFAVAVFKDNMYWDDWKQSMIFVSDKDHGLGLRTIMGQLVGLMDLKVFASSVQVGTNKCSNTSLCSHICLGAPNNEYVCLCPDGMEMDDKGTCACPGGIPAYLNSTCPRVASTCNSKQFSCNNGVCVPELWKCDGDNDCGDNSDELHCNRSSCQPNHFACDEDKCIPRYWVCDFDNDCKDKTDELLCHYPNCTDAQFKCDSGQCISRRWYCDGETDCRDASDEKNCPTAQPNTCETGQFLCNKTNYQMCIPMAWRCDGESDCEGATDEAACEDQKCEDWQFACKATKRCIYASWVCDGDNDCTDGSDEVDCHVSTQSPPFQPPTPLPNNTCSDWMFRCNNKKCVPYWWKCDSVDDCGDNSDEAGCGNPDSPSVAPPTTESPRNCGEYQFQCYDGKCVHDSCVCDGFPDCGSGEDEQHCGIVGCRTDQFKCRSDGSCIALSSICDGITECPDGSDELGCHDQPQTSPAPISPCPSGFFPCDQTRCLPKVSFCDGIQDCYDGFDETDCEKNNNTRVYQVLLLGVDERATNATSLSLFWWISVTDKIMFEFLPSITRADSTTAWINATEWIEDMEYQFNNLEPYTKYNLTVYVKIKGESTVFPPAKYSTGMTGEGIPSPPWNVTVTQKDGTCVEVAWRPPKYPRGPITGYEVYTTPLIAGKPFSLQKTSLMVNTTFQAGTNYSFWVIAKNREHKSNFSNVASLTFDGTANIDDIEHLSVTDTTNSSVSLKWDKMLNVSGYHVTPKGPARYPAINTITVADNFVVVNKLAPGTKYTFEVNAYKNDYIGKGVTISATTHGIPLPLVPHLEASINKIEGTTVKLSWDPPKDSRKVKWQYGIYYALNMQDLFREVRTIKTGLTANIKNLQACESYMFTIGVLGEFGAGPLSPPIPVATYYNPRASPKNLRVTQSDTKYEIIVSWSSSCSRMDEPIAYTITVTETTHNEPIVKTLAKTNETILKTRLRGIQSGGKYLITVATDHPEAIPSEPVPYIAPPILPPHQLSVRSEDSGYIVYWEEHDLTESLPNNTKYYYKVLVSVNETKINETTAEVHTVYKSPFVYKNAKTDVIYSFAVRLVTEDGHQSDLSETFSITVPKNPATAKPLTIYTSNVLSFAIPICLLVVALGAALGYFVVRHRRLTNSFTQFANSHYDTRRGQATFPGTTDGLDDEDSPVIRGFSDDEPLVIA